jgi:hypothetical protein
MPIFIYGTTFRKMEEIFSESKFILLLTKTKKELWQAHTGVGAV